MQLGGKMLLGWEDTDWGGQILIEVDRYGLGWTDTVPQLSACRGARVDRHCRRWVERYCWVDRYCRGKWILLK